MTNQWLSVKKRLFVFIGIYILTSHSTNSLAQCPYTNNQYPAGTIICPSTVGQTVQISACSYTGEFAQVSGFMTNHVYTISCSGGTYITVFNTSNVPVAWGSSPLSFIPSVGGVYKTQWTLETPACTADASCHETEIQLTAVQPTAPPTPVQDPTPPECATGTSLTISGSLGLNDTWYWQDSLTGTSTTTPYSGPYPVAVNGTYYVRTYNAGSTLWSNTSSVTVSNFPTAPSPPSPTTDMNPSCAPDGSVLSVAAAPADYEYYWQGTVLNGTANTNPATATYTAVSTGTYYVSAYETATQCWSATVGIAIVVDNYIPSAPSVLIDEINVCAGISSIEVEASPAATSGTAIIHFASDYQLNNGTDTLTGTLSIPLGATITSSILTFDSVSTGASQMLSDMGFLLFGAATHPYTAFTGNAATNAGPFNYTTTADSLGGIVKLVLNNSWNTAGMFASVDLVVNYSFPEPEIHWYDSPTGTTSIGSGSPFEMANTDALPNTATAGEYTIYAASLVGGCKSAVSPISVTVFGIPFAGEDSTTYACMNEPINLYEQLQGNPDVGGVWYDSSNAIILPDIVASASGSFTYSYIAGNGICFDDTSYVMVVVQSDCDYLVNEEVAFERLKVYPNPTTGIIYIDSDKVLDMEIRDANGRMIESDYKTTLGFTTVDLSNFQVGIYFVKLSNKETSQVFKVIVKP